MSVDLQKFLSWDGLKTYSQKLKNYIIARDSAILDSSKEYSDSLSQNYDPTGTAQEKVDELKNGQVTENTKAISILNGTSDGSVDKKISDAFNSFASNLSNDGVVNTYKELVDYAAEHQSETAAIVSDITKLKSDVGTLPVGENNLSDYITEIKENLSKKTQTNADNILKLFNQDTSVKDNLENLNKSIGTNLHYDDNKEYSIGDICYASGSFFECIKNTLSSNPPIIIDELNNSSINTEYWEKREDLTAEYIYQRKLTAGDNIKISDDNIISAEIPVTNWDEIANIPETLPDNILQHTHECDSIIVEDKHLFWKANEADTASNDDLTVSDDDSAIANNDIELASVNEVPTQYTLCDYFDGLSETINQMADEISDGKSYSTNYTNEQLDVLMRVLSQNYVWSASKYYSVGDICLYRGYFYEAAYANYYSQNGYSLYNLAPGDGHYWKKRSDLDFTYIYQRSLVAGDKISILYDSSLQKYVISSIVEKGTDGKDGFSPVITTSKQDGTTTITITDAEGTKTATILDGEKGDKGDKGDTPVKGTDYFTDADKTEMVAAVLAQVTDATEVTY